MFHLRVLRLQASITIYPPGLGRALCASASSCCPAPMSGAFVDIDSLLRPVYGHAKQGASYGHTKIAGKQILRKGPCRSWSCRPAAAPRRSPAHWPRC